MFVFVQLLWLLTGSSAVEFSTLEGAWQSIIRISLGESENFYPQILEAQPSTGPIVVVLYQVLVIVLLLNVVIAIILEVRVFPFPGLGFVMAIEGMLRVGISVLGLIA